MSQQAPSDESQSTFRPPKNQEERDNAFPERKTCPANDLQLELLPDLDIASTNDLWRMLKPYQRDRMRLIREYAYQPSEEIKRKLLHGLTVSHHQLSHSLAHITTTLPFQELILFNMQFPIDRIIHSLTKRNFKKAKNTWLPLLKTTTHYDTEAQRHANESDNTVQAKLVSHTSGATPVLDRKSVV